MARSAVKGLLKVFLGGHVMLGGYVAYTGNDYFYKNVVMPCVRLVDAENAHRLAVIAAKYKILPRIKNENYPALRTNVWGLSFDNPIGLAAGFDKDGEAIDGLFGLGFGFIEIGSITPKPQSGNPKPRVFRLSEDHSVINRYGFNSQGHDAVEQRLRDGFTSKTISSSEKHAPYHGMLGINLGKNKESISASQDYIDGVIKFGALCDYIVINVSSPNTPGLRSLQKKEQLSSLIAEILKERNNLNVTPLPPLLLKIAPDLTDQDKIDIATVVCAETTKVDGIIVCNTTISRPDSLKSKHSCETGGLSGIALKDMSTQLIGDMFKLTHGRIPIVGVGGITNGADIIEKMKAGASLVQLYSAFIFQGPVLVSRLKKELVSILDKEKINNISSIVGQNHQNVVK